MLDSILFPITHIIDLGGPVIAVLLLTSIVALTVCLLKLWQFHSTKIGRHKELLSLVKAWDAGAEEGAFESLGHYLAPILSLGVRIRQDSGALQRLEAEADAQFVKLESGFRILDMIAQLAPLMGLFGTVLGMIEAFQALQGAGASVDPSILAGGVWVALLTTAVGLGVAMPTSVALSWFEARIESERQFAEQAFATILTPDTGRATDLAADDGLKINAA